MFTGIIEGIGRVEKVTSRRGGRRLVICASSTTGRPGPSASLKPGLFGCLKLGESIAVNGCCLTVAAKKGRCIEADLSPETVRVTNLGKLRAGDRVNLERPLRLSDRLGGHLVQGHVDGVGRILGIKDNGAGIEMRVGFPVSMRRFLIPKGSIAIDGISMTVNRLKACEFSLVVIPHTIRKTNLAARRKGDLVNLEVDIIGKYLQSLRKK